MTVYEAIMNRRSIRKFEQKEIAYDTLEKLVDCARMAAYVVNTQPLKFMIINDEKTRSAVFEHTKWGAMIENGTPKENERPTAFIAVFGDRNIKANSSFDVEAGAAITSMMLAAVEEGLASCWLGAINRKAIKEIIYNSDDMELLFLLALGYPAQKSVAVEIKNGDTKYYMGDDNILRVPKRSLEEVIIK